MIPLVAPCITNHDRNYLSSRVHTGLLLEDEREVRRFEELFADTVGCAGAVAVCSGTAALQIALRILDVEEVTVPSYTCVAIRNAALGRRVSYVDSGFDVPSAHMAIPITAWPLVVPHMFGKPTLVGHTAHAAGEIVEDWTLSLGGVKSLTHGRVGVCSTNQSKMVSTGRGGVLFSNDLHFLHEARRLAYYEHHLDPAFSLGMSSTQAALGVSQLQQLDSFIDRRREIAATYSQRFAAEGIECPDADCGSVFFRYLIRVTDPGSRVLELAERGIEAGRGVNPLLHQLEGIPDSDFPGAVRSWSSLLSVPCHPSLTERQVSHIVEQVLEVCA